MRERLTTLACALGALLLLGTLILRGDTLAARRDSLPTTAESADNGLLGLRRWLQGEGVRTLALRERFGTLSAKPALATRGNLLIVSLPAVTSFRSDEARTLDGWVRSGNTLLVLAALRDRPAWAQFPFAMANDLELLTELRLAPAAERPERAATRRSAGSSSAARSERAEPAAGARRPDAGGGARLSRFASELSRPEQSILVPNRAHPYFGGVARALAFSDYVPVRYTLAIPRDGFALSLAHEEGSGADAFWIRPHGAGTIIVSGFGSLFSNRALGQGDNARLLANIIAASLAQGGTVVFDDEHQGLSDSYDPARFYRDPRLYATLAVIVAVWLSWVLGATQLHAPRARGGAAGGGTRTHYRSVPRTRAVPGGRRAAPVRAVPAAPERRGRPQRLGSPAAVGVARAASAPAARAGAAAACVAHCRLREPARAARSPAQPHRRH